jgi:hypothetical protein
VHTEGDVELSENTVPSPELANVAVKWLPSLDEIGMFWIDTVGTGRPPPPLLLLPPPLLLPPLPPPLLPPLLPPPLLPPPLLPLPPPPPPPPLLLALTTWETPVESALVTGL